MKNKGFTLIELLVVIAIIGILSSVVLASLNTARNKGSDAAIKSQLASIRAEAELEADGNSYSYANVCANTKVDQLFDAAVASGGSAGSCTDDPTVWAVSVPLKSDPAQSWCVDSTGYSDEITGLHTGFNCL